MAPAGTSQGISRPPFKPPTQEVISIDSDSDSNAPGPHRPSASKVAVQPGTYANAPKFASAYVQTPHFSTPQTSVPQVAYSIEPSNGNGYIKTSNANAVGSVNGAAQQPTERQLEKMPAITIDVNEVFENQSVTTTADHLERGTLAGDSDGENEDDEKTLFDESFPEIGDDALLNSDDPEMCTLQEARHYRNLLRELGPRRFVAQTVENDTISAKKLITAFGCASPSWMVGAEDIQYYPYLQWALIRELNKRTKIDDLNTVDDAARLLRKSKNIIVLTGAGISTSLGIPDFRSKDIGLYAKLEHLGLADPQEVFDIELFREDPSIFYSVAKDIIPDHKRFTPTHAFIKLLQDKGKLLTNYSQNIDNIEGVAGVKPEKLIQCHGSFATASCTKCGAKVPGASIFKEIRDGVIPRCKRCIQNLKPSEVDGRKRKRSKNRSDSKKKSRKSKDFEDSSEEEEGAYDLPVAGVMKPDITFFGEALPDTFHERLTKHDRPLVDLVIVIGTSLKVAPVSEVVDFLDKVPTIYISREPVKHIYFDIDLLGDCDIVVAELCRRAGWGLDHEMIPQGQKISVTGDPNFPSRWTFKQTYPAPKAKDEEGKGKLEEELDKEMVDGRIVKVKKERKLPERAKGCESPHVKKGKQKQLQTWMEDGRSVTRVDKGIKREKKISTWMENGREVIGEFQVKDSDSD